MTKIPVLETIRAAYRFTFTHLGAIIGLIWLPMILATVIGFFVLQRFFAALADAFASNNFALAGPAILGLISFVLVGLLLLAMMAVPVMQLALGSRKTGALAHFAFGMPEWRLFRSSLGVAAFLLALLLIVSTVASGRARPKIPHRQHHSPGHLLRRVDFLQLALRFPASCGGGGGERPGAAQKLDPVERKFLADTGHLPRRGFAGAAFDDGGRTCDRGSFNSGVGFDDLDRHGGGPDAYGKSEHAGHRGHSFPDRASGLGLEPGRQCARLPGTQKQDRLTAINRRETITLAKSLIGLSDFDSLKTTYSLLSR